MTFSLCILGFFAAGIAAGLFGVVPEAWSADDLALIALYVLLVFVGMGVGSDSRSLSHILKVRGKVVLVPLGIAVGSLMGAGVVALFLPGLNFREGMAVGAGFGYYSLSSILISQMHSQDLGVIALLSNIIREVITLVGVSLFIRLGPLGPIASGGATAMDTTLPLISRYIPGEYTVIAVFSGLVLSLLVPLLIPMIL
ncbi:MAG: lysine exporter LysO family protein [Desulfovibrionales bacterium]